MVDDGPCGVECGECLEAFLGHLLTKLGGQVCGNVSRMKTIRETINSISLGVNPALHCMPSCSTTRAHLSLFVIVPSKYPHQTAKVITRNAVAIRKVRYTPGGLMSKPSNRRFTDITTGRRFSAQLDAKWEFAITLGKIRFLKGHLPGSEDSKWSSSAPSSSSAWERNKLER